MVEAKGGAVGVDRLGWVVADRGSGVVENCTGVVETRGPVGGPVGVPGRGRPVVWPDVGLTLDVVLPLTALRVGLVVKSGLNEELPIGGEPVLKVLNESRVGRVVALVDTVENRPLSSLLGVMKGPMVLLVLRVVNLPSAVVVGVLNLSEVGVAVKVILFDTELRIVNLGDTELPGLNVNLVVLSVRVRGILEENGNLDPGNPGVAGVVGIDGGGWKIKCQLQNIISQCNENGVDQRFSPQLRSQWTTSDFYGFL